MATAGSAAAFAARAAAPPHAKSVRGGHSSTRARGGSHHVCRAYGEKRRGPPVNRLDESAAAEYIMELTSTTAQGRGAEVGDEAEVIPCSALRSSRHTLHYVAHY